MKKMMFILSAVLLASVAQAGAPKFAAADKDKDSFVSQEEYIAAFIAAKPEMAGKEKNLKQWFARRDLDKDGKLTEKEFKSKPAKK